MSRRTLRASCGQSCGDLLLTGSSHTTAESVSSAQDVQTHIGLQQFVLECITTVKPCYLTLH